MTCERLLQAVVADGDGRGPSHHDKVLADQLAAAAAKSFAYQPLEPVAVDRAAHLFL